MKKLIRNLVLVILGLVLLHLPLVSFAQLEQLEEIDGQYVFTKGKFSILTDKGEVVLIKDILMTDNSFEIMKQFGDPSEIIIKEDFVETTKEFVFNGLRMIYGDHGGFWELDYIGVSGNYGIVPTDLNGKLLSGQTLRVESSINDFISSMSNGRIINAKKDFLKLRRYAFEYDENRNLTYEVDEKGNFVIYHWSWIELTLDDSGNITKIEYFIDNHT